MLELVVFGNDLRDHCAIAVVRSAKLPKTKTQILLKRDFKPSHEQAFWHHLSNFEWKRISLPIGLAWKFFHDELLKLINKHAPLRKFRIKGRNNP